MKTLYALVILMFSIIPALADLQANALPRPIGDAALARFQQENGYRLPGDTNYDNKINLVDLLLIRNHLNSNELSGDNWVADVNDDGRVSICDLIFTRNRMYETTPFVYFSDGAQPVARMELNQGDIVPIFFNIANADSISAINLQLNLDGPLRVVSDIHYGNWFTDNGTIVDLAPPASDRLNGYLLDSTATGDGDLAWFEIEYLGSEEAMIRFDLDLYTAESDLPIDMGDCCPLRITPATVPVPVPSSLGLLAFGSAGLMALRIRRGKNRNNQ